MSQHRLFVSAVILGAFIAVGFIFSVPHTTNDQRPETVPRAQTPVPEVSLREVYKKGEYLISGAIVVPNVCTSVTAQASLVEDASTTPHILVAVAVKEDTGVCLQIPARVAFSASVAAPPALPIVASVNGALASTTPL